MLKDILTLAEVYILFEKFRTEERANEFLYHAHYTQIMFKKEFKHCVVKKVTVAIT